jgi:phage gpG-like protein
MKVELNFQELDHIVRVYQKRGENFAADLAGPISHALHAEVLEVFETDGYGKWPDFWWKRRGLPKPGSTPRKDGKRRRGKSYRRWRGEPQLLRDRGILIGSLTPYTVDDLVEVYTNVPYAKYHVSRAPRRIIPLRDFFDIDTLKFEQDVVRMIEVHLDRPFSVAAE